MVLEGSPEEVASPDIPMRVEDVKTRERRERKAGGVENVIVRIAMRIERRKKTGSEDLMRTEGGNDDGGFHDGLIVVEGYACLLWRGRILP